jgi:hypothetical protein
MALSPLKNGHSIGVEQSAEERLDFFEQILVFEEQSRDLRGQAIALEEIAGICEGEQKKSCHERLLSLYEEMGDTWNLLEVRQEIQADWADPAARPTLEEKLAFARQLGDTSKTISALRNLAGNLRINGDWEEAVGLFEEAAALDFDRGDIRGGVHSIETAEEARETGKRPPVPKKRAYLHGDIRILEKEDGRLYPGGASSGSLLREPFPPLPLQTPMIRFPNHSPFVGISLLNDDIGATLKRSRGVGRVGNMGVSTLKSKSEKVTTSTHSFTNCAQIETFISTSAEDLHLDESLERERGYYAGTKTTWFAPGIGLVRLLYQHGNGDETDIQLMDYEITGAREEFFPLTLGNRWRYHWIDPGSGTLFEELLCLAAHEDEKWFFATVTQAEIEEKSS